MIVYSISKKRVSLRLGLLVIICGKLRIYTREMEIIIILVVTIIHIGSTDLLFQNALGIYFFITN